MAAAFEHHLRCPDPVHLRSGAGRVRPLTPGSMRLERDQGRRPCSLTRPSGQLDSEMRHLQGQLGPLGPRRGQGSAGGEAALNAGLRGARRSLLVNGYRCGGVVGGGAPVALHANRAGGDELPDREREIPGRGPEHAVELLDAEPWVGLDARDEALRQGVKFLGGALVCGASRRTADAARAADAASRHRAAWRRARTADRRVERLDCGAPREINDLVNEVVHQAMELLF
jgi:hypothetical protein